MCPYIHPKIDFLGFLYYNPVTGLFTSFPDGFKMFMLRSCIIIIRLKQ